jgi:hypothetical protein
MNCSKDTAVRLGFITNCCNKAACTGGWIEKSCCKASVDAGEIAVVWSRVSREVNNYAIIKIDPKKVYAFGETIELFGVNVPSMSIEEAAKLCTEEYCPLCDAKILN